MKRLAFVLALAFAFVIGASTQHPTPSERADIEAIAHVEQAIFAPAQLQGCNNTPLAQDVTQAFTTISTCVISSITSGALSNPVLIAAQCGGIVIAQVIAVIENELARRQADAAVGASQDVAKLEAVLASAKALVAQGGAK